MVMQSIEKVTMTDSPSPQFDTSAESAPANSQTSGGVNLDVQHDLSIGSDAVGRDKIESAGHDIIHVASGATINVVTGEEKKQTPRQRLNTNQGSTKKQRTSKDATRVPIIVAIIGTVAVLGAAIINNIAPLGLGPAPLKCPYQGASDPITLANLINAEAEAVNRKDMPTLEMIFTPNARIRNRMNDKSATEKTLEWTSPQAYYRDFLFATTTVTSTIHSTIVPAGQGIGSAEAWLTSGSSGYANGARFENVPGSDHWRFIKNQAGCWGIAEFDFNANHIPFP